MASVHALQVNDEVIGVYSSKDAAIAAAVTDWQRREPIASRDSRAQIGQAYLKGGYHAYDLLYDKYFYNTHEFVMDAEPTP